MSIYDPKQLIIYLYKSKLTMRAMVLNTVSQPIRLVELPIPEPKKHEVVVKILACGVCEYCHMNKENLSSNAKFTEYQWNVRYCEYTIADHRYCFPLNTDFRTARLAPAQTLCGNMEKNWYLRFWCDSSYSCADHSLRKT